MTDPGTDLTTLRLGGKTVAANVREALTDASLTRTIEGASTLDLTVHDPKRALVRSALLLERTSAVIDGNGFELVQVRKTGSSLQVVFEDAVVADLRRDTGLLSVKAGTTTIDAFAKRLVAGAPGAKLVAFAGQRNLAPLVRGSESEPKENSWQALQRLAEERGWRCFADRGVVYLGPDSWLLSRVPTVTVREHTDGIDDLDWDADAGKRATRATFGANIARWSAAPGTSVTLLEQGLGGGVWMVEEVTRPLFTIKGTVTLVRQQPVIPEPKPEPRDDGGPATKKPTGTGKSVTGPISARGFSWPLSGTLTSGFGQRQGRLHAGQDISCPTGTPVGAAKGGTVTFAGTVDGYGTAVYVEHDGGITTRYAHLSVLQVRRGDEVDRGEVIALSGNTGESTGPHLHLEVRSGGSAVDPLPFLPSRR
jgi:murein DD-endopeptidase MepM/ murein hydrolase activator NlpD